MTPIPTQNSMGNSFMMFVFSFEKVLAMKTLSKRKKLCRKIIFRFTQVNIAIPVVLRAMTLEYRYDASTQGHARMHYRARTSREHRLAQRLPGPLR